MSPDALINQLIGEQARAQAALLEQAVEEALQHGSYGVLALHGPNGRLIANEHPRVPYGHLYEGDTDATTREGLIEAFATWGLK